MAQKTPNVTNEDRRVMLASARKLLLDAERITNKALRRDIMMEAAAIIAVSGPEKG